MVKRSRGARAGLLLPLALVLSGCHIHRPGEFRPQPIPACEPQRIADLEARFEQITPTERELLTYCRDAEAALALHATQEHVDYIADLQYLGILLGLLTGVLTIVAAVGS
jgi:hypothetical protein